MFYENVMTLVGWMCKNYSTFGLFNIYSLSLFLLLFFSVIDLCSFFQYIKKKTNRLMNIVLNSILGLGPVWSSISNLHFHILNNISHISTHFFIHTYFKKLQTTFLKLLYQTPSDLLFSSLFFPFKFTNLVWACFLLWKDLYMFTFYL